MPFAGNLIDLKTVMTYLSEHPEIMEELEQKIRAHYHIGAEGDVEENEEAATAEGVTKEEE